LVGWQGWLLLPQQNKEKIVITKISDTRIEMTGEDLLGTWGDIVISAATWINVDHLHAIQDSECIGHVDARTWQKEGIGDLQPSDFDKIVADEWHE